MTVATTATTASERATTWLDPAEAAAWRAYIETYADLTSALERDLAEHGFTLGDYQVLVFLSEAEQQAMRMCDLADLLQLSPSGLTRRLDGLVKAGYVTRQGSQADRRVMMAVLSPSGLDALRRVAPHHVRSVRRRIFDHLSADQIAALESIFTTIRRALFDGGDGITGSMSEGAVA